MALGVRNCRTPWAVVVLCGKETIEIVVGVVTHSELARGIVDVGPVDLAVVAHCGFFFSSGKVFVDMYAVGFYRFDDIVETSHSVDSARL